MQTFFVLLKGVPKKIHLLRSKMSSHLSKAKIFAEGEYLTLSAKKTRA